MGAPISQNQTGGGHSSGVNSICLPKHPSMCLRPLKNICLRPLKEKTTTTSSSELGAPPPKKKQAKLTHIPISKWTHTTITSHDAFQPKQMENDANEDPLEINPCSLIWGCPWFWWGLFTFGGEHPLINKLGLTDREVKHSDTKPMGASQLPWR